MSQSQPYILSLDLGTHAVRAAVVSTSGQIVSDVAHCPLVLSRLDSLRVEQDPAELLEAVSSVLAQVRESFRDFPRISTASLAIQRSSVVAWCRETGRAFSPILSWQDKRGVEMVDSLAAYHNDITAKSGLVVSPHYGASKLKLLQDELQFEHAQTLCVGPLVSFVLYHLLSDGPVVCDETNAGRTQLWNVERRQWDQSLLTYFGVNPQYLPRVMPAQSDYGLITGTGIPLRSVCGDQNAAFSAVIANVDKHRALVNCGSGGFVLAESARKPSHNHGLLVGVANSTESTLSYVLEGTVNGCGTAFTWYLEQIRSSAHSVLAELRGEGALEHKVFAELDTWAGEWETSEIFVNGVGGLGSPWWVVGLEPHFVSLDGLVPTSALPETLLELKLKLLAILESIAFLICHNIKVMTEELETIDTLVLSGGVSRLNYLCQCIADLSGKRVLRTAQHEATLIGGALLATGNSSKYQSGTEGQVFDAAENMALNDRYRQACAIYKKLNNNNN